MVFAEINQWTWLELPPNELGQHFDKVLSSRLRQQYEGKLIEGNYYIAVDEKSIRLLDRPVIQDGTSLILCRVRFISVCYRPFRDEVLYVKVNKVTKVGLLADFGVMKVFVSSSSMHGWQWSSGGVGAKKESFVSQQDGFKITEGSVICCKLLGVRPESNESTTSSSEFAFHAIATINDKISSAGQGGLNSNMSNNANTTNSHLGPLRMNATNTIGGQNISEKDPEKFDPMVNNLELDAEIWQFSEAKKRKRKRLEGARRYGQAGGPGTLNPNAPGGRGYIADDDGRSSAVYGGGGGTALNNYNGTAGNMTSGTGGNMTASDRFGQQQSSHHNNSTAHQDGFLGDYGNDDDDQILDDDDDGGYSMGMDGGMDGGASMGMQYGGDGSGVGENSNNLNAGNSINAFGTSQGQGPASTGLMPNSTGLYQEGQEQVQNTDQIRNEEEDFEELFGEF